MKTLIMLYGLEEGVLGQPLYERLRQIYPEAAGDYIFPDKALDGDDPRSRMVLDCLAEQGWFPFTSLGLQGTNEYGMNLVRVYEPADFEECRYMVLRPKQLLDEGLKYKLTRSENGQIFIPRRYRRSPRAIGRIEYSVLVSTRIKRLLEKEQMQYLVLREAVTLSGREQEKPAPICWEVTSDLTLPPLSSSMRKVNDSGEVVSGAAGQKYLLREGLSIPAVLYRPAEYHYETEALRAIEPFDFALTLETIGGKSPWHSLIVSQRAYQFCIKNRLKVDWVPVRTDPWPGQAAGP